MYDAIPEWYTPSRWWWSKIERLSTQKLCVSCRGMWVEQRNRETPFLDACFYSTALHSVARFRGGWRGGGRRRSKGDNSTLLLATLNTLSGLENFDRGSFRHVFLFNPSDLHWNSSAICLCIDVFKLLPQTDLRNTDYTLEAGATRLFEAEKLAQKMAEQKRKEKEKEELNSMKVR